MERMMRSSRSGRPPLPMPPRSPKPPSGLVPSQPHGQGQGQVMKMMSSSNSTSTSTNISNGGGNGTGSFPEGLSRNPQQSPISTTTGVGVSATDTSVAFSRTESMNVSEARGGGRQPPPDMDDRRFRRLLSNRVSAQRSRLRRTNYINELETQAKQLEAQILTLSPEVIVYQGQKKLLQLENDLMKQKKVMLEEHLNHKHEEAAAHSKEIFQLKSLFQMQQQPEQAWLSSCGGGGDGGVGGGVSGPPAVDYTTGNQVEMSQQQDWPSQNMLWDEQIQNLDMLQTSGWELPGVSSSSVAVPDQDKLMASDAFHQLNSELQGLI